MASRGFCSIQSWLFFSSLHQKLTLQLSGTSEIAPLGTHCVQAQRMGHTTAPGCKARTKGQCRLRWKWLVVVRVSRTEERFRLCCLLTASFSGCSFSGLSLRCRLVMGIRREDGRFLSTNGRMGLDFTVCVLT